MDRSENMRRIKSRNTAPEMALRRLVHGMGYRYRLHRADLPGTPDMVFPGRRKVIFLHGCFWHDHGCKLSHTPKSNASYWGPKLARNRLRDQANVEALRDLGWKCLVIWECDVAQLEKVRKRVTKYLRIRKF